jgi:hypothetical protein
MKQVFMVIAFTILISNCWAVIPVISIETAIHNGVLSADFSYFSSPRHKSIRTHLQNKTETSYCIDIPPGTLLESEVENYQNHLITKHDTFIIRPKQIRDVILTGMCCESYDNCPAKNSKFFIRQQARPELIQLCKMADSLHLNGHETQSAIWALANRSSPNFIYGGDSLSVMRLRNYVGNFLQKPVEIYHVAYYVKHVTPSAVVPFNYDNTIFVDSLTMKDKITLELYSEDDEFIGAIPHEQQFIYMQTLNLFLSSIKLNNLSANSNYIIRLKRNNVVYREWLYMVA